MAATRGRKSKRVVTSAEHKKNNTTSLAMTVKGKRQRAQDEDTDAQPDQIKKGKISSRSKLPADPLVALDASPGEADETISEEKKEDKPKRKNRAKIKPENRLYNPKSGSSSGNKKTMLKNFRHVTTEEKTSFLIKDTFLEGRTPERVTRFEQTVLQEARNSLAFSPLISITRRSDRGTPRAGMTASGAAMELATSNGLLRFFKPATSSPVRPPRKMVTEIDKKTAEQIEIASPYRGVKQRTHEKAAVTTISAKTFNAATRQIKNNNGARCLSSAKVMAADQRNPISADSYGKLFIAALKCEWTHIVMYRLVGDKAQAEKNMGCAAFNANTDMLNVEFTHTMLLKMYPEGYQLEVKPHFIKGIEGSQYLTNLEYTIRTKDFSLPFVFNCQTDIVPDISHHIYNEALVAAAIGLREELKLEDPALTLQDAPGVPQPIVLFSTPTRPRREKKEENSGLACALFSTPTRPTRGKIVKNEEENSLSRRLTPHE